MAAKQEDKKEIIEFAPTLTKQDKEKMSKQFNLIALRIPCQNIGKLGQSLKQYTFQRKSIKSFQTDPQNVVDSTTNKPKFKCLLLNESIKTSELDGIPKNLIELINECEAKPMNYSLTLDYDKLSTLEVLQSVIFKDNDKIKEIPTHYESVGPIIHFNLRDDLLKYKYLIGQVYKDKLPNSVRTIINKTASISNQFRVFPMEVIAGENNFEATVKENGVKFSFDFSKVYWNSRLGTEHQRIIDSFDYNDIICDMMAGVGPFTIPAAKNKHCIVYANDLNPNSFKYLQQNCKLNNVEHNVNCHNLDGRQFWKQLCSNKQDIIQQNIKICQEMTKIQHQNKNTENKEDETKMDKNKKFIDHVIMNLPAIAMEFLDVFRDCFDSNEIETVHQLPMIHCYCFAPDVNPEKSIHERLNKHLGCIPDKENLKIRMVRNVAPHKDMYCVSFRLPKEIALCTNESKDKVVTNGNDRKHKLAENDINTDNQPPPKRRKIDE